MCVDDDSFPPIPHHPPGPMGTVPKVHQRLDAHVIDVGEEFRGSRGGCHRLSVSAQGQSHRTIPRTIRARSIHGLCTLSASPHPRLSGVWDLCVVCAKSVSP
jgi:hypothetical protein